MLRTSSPRPARGFTNCSRSSSCATGFLLGRDPPDAVQLIVGYMTAVHLTTAYVTAGHLTTAYVIAIYPPAGPGGRFIPVSECSR